MDRESQWNALLSSVLRKLDDLERRVRRIESLDGAELVKDWTTYVLYQTSALTIVTVNAAYYAVFGDLVFIHLNVNGANGTTNILSVGGLPYNAAISTNQPCVGSFRYLNGATGNIGSVLVYNGDTSRFLFQTDTGSNFTGAVDSDTEFSFTAFYRRA